MKMTTPLSLNLQKQCSSCKRNLPLECFTKCHFSYYAKCKECHARDKKKRYKEDSEYRAVQQRASSKTNAKRYTTEEGRYKSLLAVQKHRAAGSLSIEQWFYILKLFNNECAYCGLPLSKHYIRYKGETKLGDFHKEHVDHEGANDLSNCIPSCKECNSSKSTKFLEDWYNENNLNFNQDRLNKIHKWINEDYKLYIEEPKPNKA